MKAITANGKKQAVVKPTLQKKEDLVSPTLCANTFKSNAIALVKNKQLIGKGCGQTSRIDALRQAVEKARQFT